MPDESTLDKLKSKLHRALRHKAILTERSKMLAQQLEDARRREEQSDHVVNEVMERQRELSFMLHRANTVLHRMQEANVALSAEFHDLVKELPEPDAPGWDDRVAKINDLFKKTGALADEAEGDIFGKQTNQSSSREESDAPKDPPSFRHEATQDEVSVEPEVQDQDPARSEILPAAETIDQAIEAEHITEATFTPAQETETDRMDRIERLFGSQAVETTDNRPVELAPPAAPRRPGLIRRMWRRMMGRGRKHGSHSSPDNSQPIDTDQSEDARSSAA